MTTPRKPRPLLACLCVLLVPVLLLWPSLSGREAYLPFSIATFPPFRAELSAEQLAALEAQPNGDVTEIPVTFIPELHFARDELAAGRLPHWNPYARFGASLLATSVVGLLYPPNWLTFVAMDPTTGLALNAYLAMAIAGLLMLGFLRAVGLGAWAATFGALAFACSGTLMANLHFYQRAHALVWLPGMLWAISAMARSDGRARWRAGIGLSTCVSLSWLAGFPSYAAAATLVAGLYGLVTVLAKLRDGARSSSRLGVALPAFAGAGLLLAAVQLLPMFAFFPESNRQPDPSRDLIAGQGFDPIGMAGYALPDPFATPARPAKPPSATSPLVWHWFSRESWDTGVPFVPNFNSTEYAVYPGALTLLLAVLGLLFGRGSLRWFAAFGLGALWLLAFAGPATAAINDLPFIRSVPPMRFIGPAAALVALLAALGLDALLTATSRWPTRAGVSLAAAAALACGVLRMAVAAQDPTRWLHERADALAAHYKPRLPYASPELVHAVLGGNTESALQLMRDNLGYAAVAFAAVALWFALRRWLLDGSAQRLWVAAAVLGTTAELLCLAWPINRGRPDAALRSSALEFLRVQRDARASEGGFSVIRAAQVPTEPTALPPVLANERIRDLHNYTFVDARSHELFSSLFGADHMIRGFWPKSFPDDARLQHPLFDLLAVRYVLAERPTQHAGTLVHQAKAAGGEFFVYERANVLPRAFVVSKLREITDDRAAVQAMTGAELQPREAVLVDAQAAAALGREHGRDGAQARTVQFTRDTPTELELTVSQGPAGYLVMSDTLMRGWRAQVDGREVAMARGNLFMRVLALPEGPCRVRMTFDSPRLGLGAAVSGFTALLLVLGLRWSQRREPPTRIPLPAA